MERLLQQFNVSSDLYNQKISETEILYLQDLFLTPGFHQLKFSNLKTAREQLYAILDSLQYYQNTAGLSLQTLGFREDITDLYSELLQHSCLDQPDNSESENFKLNNYGQQTPTAILTSENLINFCLDNFYYDFLWIEKPKELAINYWYQHLLELIADFKLDQLIPIFLVEL